MRTVVETNVFGVIRVTNAMLPLLRRSASPRIVNMSSGVGSLTRQSATAEQRSTGPIAVAYSPSKTFLNAVTIQYAKELRDTNILINAACPGYVATDLNGFRGVRTPEQGAAIAIRLATLPDDGPTGELLRRRRRGALVTFGHRPGRVVGVIAGPARTGEETSVRKTSNWPLVSPSTRVALLVSVATKKPSSEMSQSSEP